MTCLALLLQIDAHVGCVNDIAFAHPNKQLCVVTCGEDKLIKVRESFHENLCFVISFFFALDILLVEKNETGMGYEWEETI